MTTRLRDSRQNRTTADASQRQRWTATAVVLLLLGVVLVCSAWQADDAFITFRTVKNIWAGDGPTWNPGQRVQTFTHPAWLLLATLCFGLTSECYFSVLVLSLCLTLICAWRLLSRITAHVWWIIVVALALSLSRAFCEYAVSGLENPLLFLALVCFAEHALRPVGERRPLVWSSLVALVGLTRADALLIVGPAALTLALAAPRARRTLAALLLGTSPLLIWELFSLVYYGALIPNTALAKLNVTLPASVLAEHGLAYLADSARVDPWTLLLTSGCCTWLVATRRAVPLLAAAGVLLYLGYLVRIGGDFMSGRMLGAPMVWAFACLLLGRAQPLLQPEGRRWLPRAVAGVLAAYGVLWPLSPWHVDLQHGAGHHYADLVNDSGVADERAFYYPATGLLPVLSRYREIKNAALPIPPYETAIRGRDAASSSAPLIVADVVGFLGYFADAKDVVDLYALTDPLLARVPFSGRGREKFRAGHLRRTIPEGYLESRARGVNTIVDAKYSLLYDRLQLVTRGPLFAGARWRAIWCLNTDACGP